MPTRGIFPACCASPTSSAMRSKTATMTVVGLTVVAVLSGLARGGHAPARPLPTPFCRAPLLVCPTFNVQAFIRRAPSMADKTSSTKPLACMTYDDSNVGTAWLAAGTVGGAGGRRYRTHALAEAGEAVGHHVEQEAAEELIDVEVHDLPTVAVGVVPPAEVDAAVGDRAEAVVGDGDAVRVAAEIREHMVGPGEGRLAVDDPGLLAQRGEPRRERGGRAERSQAASEMQFAPIERPLQTGEIAAAEDLGQGADREEEVGPSGNPAPAIGHECAAGHDAVNVHVLSERLAPGVEHGGHAEVTAEVARIATEARQRGGSGVKEQPIDQARVALRQRVEGVGEREDDVKVRNRQDLAPARGEPAFGGHALAFRAVAIATGVVGDPFGAARRADGAMAAEH